MTHGLALAWMVALATQAPTQSQPPSQSPTQSPTDSDGDGAARSDDEVIEERARARGPGSVDGSFSHRMRAHLARAIDDGHWTLALALEPRFVGDVRTDDARYAFAYASYQLERYDDAERFCTEITSADWFTRATELRAAIVEARAQGRTGVTGPIAPVALAPGLEELAAPAAPEADVRTEAPPLDTQPQHLDTEPLRTVRVTARDLDGRPLSAAQIVVPGMGALATTDAEGHAVVDVPVTTTALSIVTGGYEPIVLALAPSSSSVSDAPVELTASLVPRADSLAELIVRAPRLDVGTAATQAERRESRAVVEVMDVEQMKRAGDGDAAAALKRATGLTIVGGRYAYIRGLGDRYSTTLLEGALLPSPEPEKHAVPLDMFPSGALSGLVVQKTWTPDLPGEFGGGAVILRGARVPDAPFLRAGLSLGLVGGTSLHEGLTYDGGRTDLLGFDDGTRALPKDVGDASRDQPLAEKNALTGDGYSDKQLERFGESMSDVYSPKSFWVPPNVGASFAAGDSFATPVGRFGAALALMYGLGYSTTRKEQSQVAIGASNGESGATLIEQDKSVVSGTSRDVALGGVLGLAWDFEGQEIASTTFVHRNADDEARVMHGISDESQGRVRATRLRLVERSLLSERLQGTHALPFLDSRASWRYAYALALRDEPDERETRYEEDVQTGRMLLSDRPEGNQRMFSSLVDHAHDGGVSWRVPFPTFFEEDAAAEVGLAGTYKTRAVDTRRFKLNHKGPDSRDTEVRVKNPEQIFTPDRIDSDGFVLGETTRKTDNYFGDSEVAAAFAKVEVPLAWGLEADAGARFELFRMNVTTYELFNAGAAPTSADIQTWNLFPSAGLGWTFLDDMKLRAAFALTASRPEMRELSPAVFTDVTGGRSRYGNPALVPATIAHADLRYEWYFSSTESISTALFYKHFDKPIETVIAAGADQAITYENAPSADSGGIEIEVRKDFSMIHPALARLSVGGNGALIASRVTLPKDGIHTSKERALEGQSPWIANAQVAWDDDDLGTHAAVLYNVFGPRIVEVGVLGTPDVVEQPFHQLDVVVSQELGFGLTLSVKAQNVLDLPAEHTQEDVVVERLAKGRALSLGLGFAL